MQKQIMAYLETTKTVPSNGFAIVSDGTTSYKMKLPKSTADQKADISIDAELKDDSQNMVANSAVSIALNQKEPLDRFAGNGSKINGVYTVSYLVKPTNWPVKVEQPDYYNTGGVPVYNDTDVLLRNSRGVETLIDALYIW